MARPDLATFLRDFVHPLVAGGEVHVRRPLTVDDVLRWELDLGHASVETVEIDDARERVLSTVVCRPPGLILERDDLALTAGLHNALFLAHPEAEGVLATERMRRRVIDTTQALVSQPLTRNRTRVLARHALLHNLFDLARTDVQLSWWTGRARFLGQAPPTRLLRWKSVRRVREEVSTAAFDELLGAPDIAPVIAILLRRSPLTQLCVTHPVAPGLHWEDAAFVLRDAELARAVAYAALSDSAEPREQISTPARFAGAFEQMIERTAPAADVRAVAAFLVHLNALLVIGERGARDPSGRSALIASVLAPERAGQRPRGLSTFFALPNALTVADPRIAVPPGILDDPVLARRWNGHRAQVAEAVGDAVIETLAARLARHLSDAPVDPMSVVALPNAPEA